MIHIFNICFHADGLIIQRTDLSPIISVTTKRPNASILATDSIFSSFDESESGSLDIETFYGNEPLDAYRPGGLHPVHFGDLLHHGRYMMVGKLGRGAFSTVWLTKETMYN